MGGLKNGWLCVMALTLLPAMAACQQNRTGEVKSYSRDGYLGITDVNPNMPTSPTHYTYQADASMIEKTLKETFPNAKVEAIRFNGPTLNVRMSVPAGTADDEILHIKEQAEQKLAQTAPRYRAQVTVAAK